MKEQEMMDFAPGEQEAVRVAQDFLGDSVTLRKGRRRKNIYRCAIIFLTWMTYFSCLLPYLVNWIISWTFGVTVGVPQEVYSLGKWSGVLIGLPIYVGVHHAWCLETGWHFKIRRATIPGKLVAALTVLFGLWQSVLLTIRVWPLPAKTRWSDVLWVINLTGFVLALLGYLAAVFSIEAFTTAWREKSANAE